MERKRNEHRSNSVYEDVFDTDSLSATTNLLHNIDSFSLFAKAIRVHAPYLSLYHHYDIWKYVLFFRVVHVKSLGACASFCLYEMC